VPVDAAAVAGRARTGRGTWLIWALLIAPLPLMLLALGLGRYGLSPGEVLNILVAAILRQTADLPSTAVTLVMQVRLPRIVAAVLIGAALAGSGCVFQSIFKNPLVDSNILGVTSGASFGAAVALLLTGSQWVASVAAFVCGMLAVALAWTGARVRSGSHTLMLTLSGILVGAFFAALTSLVKMLADPLDALPSITFWLLGSLSNITWQSLPALALVTVAGSSLLILLRWQLNVLSLGDHEAIALGVNAPRLKLALCAVAALMAAAAVAVGGPIGWAGLVTPHAGRLLVGPDHRRLVPVSLSLGAVFVLAIDTLSRAALPREVPLGIFTGLLGVPILFWLLSRRRLGWTWN
jgi:iron complex transport system permease protein